MKRNIPEQVCKFALAVLLLLGTLSCSRQQEKASRPTLARVQPRGDETAFVLWIDLGADSAEDGWRIATNLDGQLLDLNGCRAEIRHNGCGDPDSNGWCWAELALWVTNEASVQLHMS
mgnify:CR=1 FL=1